MSKSVLAWHFLAADRRMANETEIVKPGYIYTTIGGLKLCESGLHASVCAIDAIKYAPGPVVCRVRCSGEIIDGGDKIVCRNREVLWMANADSILRLIATECVRKTPLHDGRTVWDLLTDPRSRNAVEVAEKFAHGKATREELAAARAAAWDAARAAARAAAWDAARAAASAAAWAVQNAIATDLLMSLEPKRSKR
jgi:hypothetical protein